MHSITGFWRGSGSMAATFINIHHTNAMTIGVFPGGSSMHCNTAQSEIDPHCLFTVKPCAQ